MDYSEQLIIHGLKAGDTDAYRYIYDTHYQVLCYTAEQYVYDAFVAETLVGDVVFRLWERREALDITTSLRSYLGQSVRHAAMDYLRSKRERYEVAASRLAAHVAVPEPLATDGTDPLSHMIGHELATHATGAIAALPAECRRVFEMSRFMGKRHAEITRELGISVNTVKYHMRNELKLLTDSLGKYLVAMLFFDICK
jgi:RNA polymerase sigma-70 factor (ECF subfamily)